MTITFETRIAEVLAAHTLDSVMPIDLDAAIWRAECDCDWTFDAPEFRPAEIAHAAHQAAMLAPLIREAQAVALEDAAVEIAEDKYECYDQYYARWLDSRAARCVNRDP